MKNIAQTMTLGLAILAASAGTSRAADWAVGSGGVIGDRYAPVAVPAPTPAPAYSRDWYLRGDLGTGLATSVDITATNGIVTRKGEDLNGFLFGGIGFGRYITPSIRADVSFDFRPRKTVTQGTQTFTATKTVAGDNRSVSDGAGGTVSSKAYDIGTYNVIQTDSAATADQTVLVSVYYDFRNSSRFTPYVGVGVGLDAKQFRRESYQFARCASSRLFVEYNGLYYDYPPDYCPKSLDATFETSDKKQTLEIGFAAAIMVGVGYQVSDGIHFDVGYRGMWQGASVSLQTTTGGIATSIAVGDRIDHELRTGVRFDLN